MVVFGLTGSLVEAGRGRGVERVPGLTVSSAAVQIVALGADGDGKEFKETVDEMAVTSPGTLQFRASLQGDAAAFALLRRPGILPITHEVTACGGLRERIIEVQQVGLQEKTRPGW